MTRSSVGLVLLSLVSVAFAAIAADLEPRWYVDSLIPEFVHERPKSSAEFDRILVAPWSDGPRVQIRNGERREDRAIRSCKDLLELEGRIWKVYAPARDNELMMWKVMCRAISRMPAIRAATVNYLPRELKALVPALAGTPSFHELAQIDSVECREPSWCTVRTRSREFTIALMADGDLDGDGVRDVMLQSSSTATGSRSTATIGLILTKPGPDAPLKVIASW